MVKNQNNKYKNNFYKSESSGSKQSKSNDKRITKIVNFLRKARIDEIPQLFLEKRDISLIGPIPKRPELQLD